MSYVDVTRALGRAALKHKFRLPPYYTLVVRSLGTLEGVAAAADPSFRIYRAALPALLRLIAQDSRPRAREVLLAMVRRELKRGSGAAEEDDGTLVQERSGARATQLMRVLASREASGAR